MDIAKAIFYRLSNDTGVTTVCGNRIQSLQTKPLTNYPQIVYSCESGDTDRTFTGRSGLQKDKLRVYCKGRSDADAITLSKAVFASLDDADSRSSPGGQWDGITVQGVFFKDEDQSTESLGDAGNPTTIYVRELEFDVAWNNDN